MNRQIDFVEAGDGTAILYVPGSFSTPAAWRPVQARLPGYRHVATSLCGYGGTDDPRDPITPDLTEQTDILVACAARIGAPFHLVGHSFGGTVALQAVISGRIAPLSLTTFEANPISVLLGGPHEPLVDQTLDMALAFEAAHLAGESDAAARIIDFWGGAGSFAAMPDPARAYCRQTCGANVRDWRSVATMEFTPVSAAMLNLPVLLIRGERANPVMIATTDALAAAIPNAQTGIVAGASHFPITTHPDASADLLGGFLSRVAQTG